MGYKDKYADAIEGQFCDLENRIMADIIRRIKKTGEITSTADWQIGRLQALGYSSEEIEAFIMKALNATWPEMFELYDKVIDWEYVRNKKLYEQINAEYIPYEDNEQLQQWVEAAKAQTAGTLQNLTQTMGVVEQINGQLTFLPLTEFYQKTIDAAILDITSGAFDYNSVLKRTVNTLTRSGIRTIDYASGYSSRIAVAARRAVMTGITQMTGRVTDYNAEKLGAEYFEVAWHANARPSHRTWQGKVWTKEQLVTVCGLGSVTGLCGVNCYHEYYPFFPGLSERNWTDEWLREQNAKEDTLRTWRGKEYTAYEATQKQRQMETSMRAQRQKVRCLEEGGADPEDIIIAKARYQGQLQEYKRFCSDMDLTPQMERVYIDGLGRMAPGNRISSLTFRRKRANREEYSDIINIDSLKSVDAVETQMKKRGWFNIQTINDKQYDTNETLSLKGVDVAAAKSIYKTHEQLFGQFPQLKGKLNSVISAQLDRNTYAQCFYGFGHGGISVNKRFFKDFDDLQKQYAHDVEVGWHPKGTDANAIVMHELGHAIDDYLTYTEKRAGYNKNGSPKSVSNDLRAKVMRACGLKVSDIRIEVSEYAAENPKEWFAECFAEWMCSSTPRKVAKEFGKQIERILKEVK